MRNNSVRPKKYLGQHFLKDPNISRKIADIIIPFKDLDRVLEIGPGTGMLTQFLINRFSDFTVVEVDSESIDFLQKTWSGLPIIKGDFLKIPDRILFDNTIDMGVIGNFPYNISSQILFRVITMREHVKVFGGMFQKELAERICAKNNNKSYGILSVLSQAFYDVKYLFTVSPNVFSPPPKVESGVISMVRKEHYKLPCDEKMFFQVVKMSFNQRRKTIRNSLKSIGIPASLKENAIFGCRPEQLTVNQFTEVVNLIVNGATTT